MPTFASKLAAILLAPVVLSAGCLLCLVQAAPASATTISVSDIRQEQEQGCEDYGRTAAAPASIVRAAGLRAMADASHAVMADVMPGHPSHAPECGHEYRQDFVELGRLQTSAAFQSCALHAPSYATDVGIKDVKFPGSASAFPKRTNFLIGTTIKRE